MNYLNKIINSMEVPQSILEDNMQNIIEGFESTIDSFSTLRKFVCLEGMLNYLLFVPKNINSKTRLLVMLHGCKQTAEDFAIGTDMNSLAKKENIIVLYPQQSKINNSHGCWNWFNQKINSTGEEILIKKLTERVKSHFNIEVVYIAGLSAGGAMALILGHNYPELFRAVAVHSGLAYKAAIKAQDAIEAMKKGRKNKVKTKFKIPIIVIQGQDDNIVSYINANQIIEDVLSSYRNKSSVIISKGDNNNLSYIKRDYKNNKLIAQYWLIDNLGHNWSGGTKAGSFTIESGPKSSEIILNFFNEIET